MKWLVLCLIGVSITSLVAKPCKSNEDCEEDECCVNFMLVTWFGGGCRKLRLEGENCTPLLKKSVEFPKMYHYICPCRGGMTCKARREVKIGDVIIRKRPECVVEE